MTDDLSNSFTINFVFLQIFGIWPEKKSKYYKYYSYIFLFINLFIYNILLTLNLAYTPWKIDLLIREIIFYFTEVAVTAKVFMILLMRKKIVEAFDLLDCEAFKGGDDASRQIVEKHASTYKTCWKMYAILSNLSYSSQVFLPLFVYLIFPNSNIELPICKYYFLDESLINMYFALWYTYQALGIYGHMQYNVNVDSLMAGFIFMAIGQVKVLNLELRNLGHSSNRVYEEKIYMHKFVKCIESNDLTRTWSVFLNYCLIQEICVVVKKSYSFCVSLIIQINGKTLTYIRPI